MTVLESARLRLTPVSAAHEKELHRLHCDPLIVRALWGGCVPAPEQTHEKLAAYLEDWRQLGFGFWMVYEKRDSGLALVGRAGLRPFAGGPVIEYGHCFSAAGSGRGLAREAGCRVFEHAFTVLGLPLLVGVIAPDNPAAIRVADKLGQRFVGFRLHRGRLCRFYETTRVEFLHVRARGAGGCEEGTGSLSPRRS